MMVEREYFVMMGKIFRNIMVGWIFRPWDSAGEQTTDSR